MYGHSAAREGRAQTQNEDEQKRSERSAEQTRDTEGEEGRRPVTRHMQWGCVNQRLDRKHTTHEGYRNKAPPSSLVVEQQKP